MENFSTNDLIADIYEGALLADRWPFILDRIACRCGTMGALLFAVSDNGVRWAGSGGAVSLYEDSVALGWQTSPHNSRLGDLISARHNGFMVDIDNRPPEYIVNNPMYQQFLIPRGAVAAAATHIIGAAGDGLILSVEGFDSLSSARFHLPFLDDLRPHLARAAMVASRLQLERARAITSALKAIGVAAAVISQKGRLRAANSLFEVLVGRVVFDGQSGLRLRDASANQLFYDTLEKLQISYNHARSVPLPAKDGERAQILHLIPITGEARDLFADRAILLVMTGGQKDNTVQAALLETLFDLTPAEAKLARRLAETHSLPAIAAETGRSQNTLRAQVKSILAKTGTASQGALTALLKDLSLGG